MDPLVLSSCVSAASDRYAKNSANYIALNSLFLYFTDKSMDSQLINLQCDSFNIYIS